MIGLYEIFILFFILSLIFFSLAETAVVSASRAAILAKKERGNIFASPALWVIDRAEDILGLVMIGSNASSISATAFITLVATRTYKLHDSEIMLVGAVQTVVFLIVCEAIPKIISRFNAEKIILMLSIPLRVMLTALYPVVKSALLVSVFIKKKYAESQLSETERQRDELDALMRLGSYSGLIDEKGKTYISEILSLHKITVIEALTPTINIISVEAQTSGEELAAVIAKSRFSRIPVFEKRVDNIIGYVYYRDILERDSIKNITAGDVMRKAEYVPLTKSLYSLYRKMQTSKNHIVFAVNEFGAVVGMVSREDIAEEIVGEIQTRDHHREGLIQSKEGGIHRISGSLDIDIFARIFDMIIEKKGFETVSGFISFIAGKIPDEDSQYEYQGYVISVKKADQRMVYEIDVRRKMTRKK
jgi:putative hemolysin